MSLFPAYNEGEEGSSKYDARQDWLQNESYPDKFKATTSTAEVTINQRSTSPSTKSSSSSRGSSREKKRRYSRSRDRKSRKRKSRSTSRSKKLRKVSRSHDRKSRSHDRKSRRDSRSRDRKSRRSRSRQRKKSSKEKRKPTKEELIAKYSTKWTFIEDVGLKSEDAFRVETKANGEYLKYKNLPLNETANYRMRWKREILSDFGKRFRDPAFGAKTDDVRFYGKAYQKSFRKPEVRGDVTNLSQASNPGNISESDLKLSRLRLNVIKMDSDKMEVSSSKEEEILFDEIQLKTKNFNEKLRKNPYDEKLWIQFIDFQEQALYECNFEDGNDDSAKANSQKNKIELGNPVVRQKAVVEKKLSILTSALRDNPNSIILMTKRLKILSEISDPALVDEEWKELVERFPNNVVVLKSYVRFLSTQFSTFRVTDTVAALSSCIKKFRSLKPSKEENILYIIQLAANIWKSAGYMERGVGLYQALMEINFYCPVEDNFSLEDRLAIFEQFWDCGAARFGDDGSLGWKNVLRRKSVQEGESEPASDDFEDRLIPGNGVEGSKAKLWLDIEVHRELRDWQPYRSTEEEADDLERQVNFDDIKPFLQNFREPSSRFKLAASFLNFLGYDLGGQVSHDEGYDFNNLNTETFRTWLGLLSPEVVSFEFDDGSILRRITTDSDLDLSVQKFTRNIFQQCIAVMEEPIRTHFCCLWLQYEQRTISREQDCQIRKQKIKEMKSLVKKILEIDRNNVVVYCVYAQTLLRLESYQSAKKILQTVLSADATLYLFRFAVSIELEAHQILASSQKNDVISSEHVDEALWLLILMSLNEKYRQKNVDKLSMLSLACQAKSELVREIDNFDLQNFDGPVIRSQSQVIFKSMFFDKIFCFVWLSNLMGDDQDSLNKFIDTICLKIKDTKFFDSKILLEHVTIKLRLDLFRFKNVKLSAVKARSCLIPILRQFPSNPVLLQNLFTKTEFRPSVADQFWRESVKLLTGSGITSAIGLILLTQLLIAKFAEIENQTDDGTTCSAAALRFLFQGKALLEKATQHEDFKQVVIVWRLLMWVSKRLSEVGLKKRNPVKDVFYRAVQATPYAKVLFLDIVGYTLRDDVQVQTEVEEIMNQREIRIRLLMDELNILLEPEEQISD